MAWYRIAENVLDAIANAINAKTGHTAPMTPVEMVLEIQSIQPGGSGVTPFTLSIASSYTGQDPSAAFMLIVNAVIAAIGDKPFFAWLTSGNHTYEISYLYYIPASITQQKDSDCGWYGVINRAELPNSAEHYFNTPLAGFDPVNTTASVRKMATSGRNVSVQTTDVFTIIELSSVISVT